MKSQGRSANPGCLLAVFVVNNFPMKPEVPQQSPRPVTSETINKRLDDLFDPEREDRYKHAHSTLKEVFRNGLDYQQGNPIKRVYTHIVNRIRDFAEKWENDPEFRKKWENYDGYNWGGCSGKKSAKKNKKEW